MHASIFITCLNDTFLPRVGVATVHVLRHFGCQVNFPVQQTCCGLPAHAAGCQPEATRLVRRMADVFAESEHVVTPSAACATMVRRHAPQFAASGSEAAARVQRLATRTHELVGFLERVLHVDVAACLKLNEPVTFHYPCQARDLYSVADLERWLAGANGDLVRVPKRPDLCCGFGGPFAVELPELSTKLLDEKLDQLAATGARLVISNEAGCTLQMAGRARRRGLRLRFRHLAECLAESLELMETEP